LSWLRRAFWPPTNMLLPIYVSYEVLEATAQRMRQNQADQVSRFEPRFTRPTAMQLSAFPLSELIVAETKTPTKDLAWPTPSVFNLNFRSSNGATHIAEALRGRGLYLISYGQEIIYLGKYRPDEGKIVADRWGRHLQTITGRGHQIGLGGSRDAEARLEKFLRAVAAEGLRQALRNALEYSRLERFRDTGCNTTPNRLRFASQQWVHFGAAEPETILRGFEFRLLKIHSPHDEAHARQVVGAMEVDVLRQWHPVCNEEYIHQSRCQHARSPCRVHSCVGSDADRSRY